ncbi:MAG: GTPase [Burkholderiaceae bacterium]
MKSSLRVIDVAVAGHTNAGKTSLRAHAAGQASGEVSDWPGTTCHVEAIGPAVDGRTLMRYFDTPGRKIRWRCRYHT